ncbi:MAG: sugar phosphate nucleotidyltransferase, partial [Notoacmeibacter sp.]
MNLITPVILCGGAGSRLWPASRESFPKQLIAFNGGNSLLQETLLRVNAEGFAKPVIVAGHETRFLVAEQVRTLGLEADIILEPARRDSCAAILAATAFVNAQDPSGLLLVLAADHAIPDTAEFRQTVFAAAAAAKAGHIVTFGIVPDSPATGYGYIMPGEAVSGHADARKVLRFVEKPDKPTAEK